jgi:Domain of unknown function (DUF4331)
LASFGRRFATRFVATAATLTLGAGLLFGLGPSPSGASSHREAPLVGADPQVDGTDLYAFVSPDKPNTVTIISNWIPFEEPAGGPNFYSFAPGVRYDVNVDNDGDAKPDVVYRWVFSNHYRNPNTFLYALPQVTSLTDPDLNFYQTYDLYRIRAGQRTTLLNDVVVGPSDVGVATMPDYATLFDQAVNTHNAGIAAWAGQADDPFFLDLRVFDALYGADLSEVGHDTLSGFNVNSFAIRVPKKQLGEGGDGSGIVGIWTTAERRSVRVQRSNGTQGFQGPFVQVSRLGMPLVNEVVIPVGKKDRFNASRPQNDGQFASFVQDPELPHLINAVYGVPIPDCDGDPNDGDIDRLCDLGQVFLTGVTGLNQPPQVTASEMLRLNYKIPPCEPGSCADYSRMGVIGGDNAGFPNGRRLRDDVIDIAVQVVEGFLLGQKTGLGDGVNTNDVPFRSTFPYLALPHPGSEANPHPFAMKPQP